MNDSYRNIEVEYCSRKIPGFHSHQIQPQTHPVSYTTPDPPCIRIIFFADDTMLFSIVKNPELSANDLNHDLGVIHQWAHQWKLEFNPDPTKQATEVLFSCKTSNPNHPHIMFNGTVVAKMNEQKHLGLILDLNLSFKKHINEKIIKAKKNLGIIKKKSLRLRRISE